MACVGAFILTSKYAWQFSYVWLWEALHHRIVRKLISPIRTIYMLSGSTLAMLDTVYIYVFE